VNPSPEHLGHQRPRFMSSEAEDKLPEHPPGLELGPAILGVAHLRHPLQKAGTCHQRLEMDREVILVRELRRQVRREAHQHLLHPPVFEAR
jgi:hypothetical protein